MRRYKKPYRLRKRKSILKSRFFWLAILILIIFGGIFYLICFYSFFQVKEIKISGNEKVSSENLENLLTGKINQKILFFSSESIFLANFSEIKKEILKDFLLVEEINLERKLPHTILLQVKERKPAAIFCPIRKSTISNGVNQNDNCFFVDKKGIIFEPIDQNNLTRNDLVILKKEVEGEMNLGETIAAQEKISKILEVSLKLKDLKIPFEEILIVSEERINVKTSEGWQIYFNPERDLNWQLTKLKVVLEEDYLPQEYIDLRFGDRAFVK